MGKSSKHKFMSMTTALTDYPPSLVLSNDPFSSHPIEHVPATRKLQPYVLFFYFPSTKRTVQRPTGRKIHGSPDHSGRKKQHTASLDAPSIVFFFFFLLAQVRYTQRKTPTTHLLFATRREQQRKLAAENSSRIVQPACTETKRKELG